jgi:hypothetical protein
MKNVVFWDVALCKSCVDRRFGGTYRLHLQGSKIRERNTSVGRWLQTGPPLKRLKGKCKLGMMKRREQSIHTYKEKTREVVSFRQ